MSVMELGTLAARIVILTLTVSVAGELWRARKRDGALLARFHERDVAMAVAMAWFVAAAACGLSTRLAALQAWLEAYGWVAMLPLLVTLVRLRREIQK